MISGIVDVIPHFPRRRFARRAYVPMVCGLIGMHTTGWRVSMQRVRFSPPWNPAFRGTTLLWSTQLSYVQMSGFRVRDGLFAHCEKTNPRLGPFSFLAVFLRPWLLPPRAAPPFPWPDLRRHINYPANGRSFGIIRNLIHGYTPRRARVACMYTCMCMCVYMYIKR